MFDKVSANRVAYNSRRENGERAQIASIKGANNFVAEQLGLGSIREEGW